MKRWCLFLVFAAAAQVVLATAASAQNASPYEGGWKGRLVSKGSSEEILLYVIDGPDKTSGVVAVLGNDRREYELLNVVRRADKLVFEYGDPYGTGFLPRIKLDLEPRRDALVGTWSDNREHSGTVTLSRYEPSRQEIAGPPRPGGAAAPGPEDALTGTWTGVMVSGTASTQAELVILPEEGGLWGLMTPDVEATATDFELGHAVFKDGVLSADFQDARGPRPVLVALSLKMTDPTTLEGTFRDATGKSGTLKLILTGKHAAGSRAQAWGGRS